MSKSKWIKPDGKLPHEGQMALFYNPDLGTEIGTFIGTRNGRLIFKDEQPDNAQHFATHWQPLPPMPTN